MTDTDPKPTAAGKPIHCDEDEAVIQSGSKHLDDGVARPESLETMTDDGLEQLRKNMVRKMDLVIM
jgi:hypothetical protein